MTKDQTPTALGAIDHETERANFEAWWNLTPNADETAFVMSKSMPSEKAHALMAWQARAALAPAAPAPAAEPVGFVSHEKFNDSHGTVHERRVGVISWNAITKDGDPLYAAAPAPARASVPQPVAWFVDAHQGSSVNLKPHWFQVWPGDPMWSDLWNRYPFYAEPHASVDQAEPTPAAADGGEQDARGAIVWPKEKSVKRRDDMSASDELQVGIDESGDLQVSLWTERGYSSVEFCAGSGGGGKSPNTRRALIALMVAMEADASPSPQLAASAREQEQP